MGVILGVAVLLDTALVRLVLLPVLLRLLGKWAWYLPKPLGRLRPDAPFARAESGGAAAAVTGCSGRSRRPPPSRDASAPSRGARGSCRWTSGCRGRQRRRGSPGTAAPAHR